MIIEDSSTNNVVMYIKDPMSQINDKQRSKYITTLCSFSSTMQLHQVHTKHSSRLHMKCLPLAVLPISGFTSQTTLSSPWLASPARKFSLSVASRGT